MSDKKWLFLFFAVTCVLLIFTDIFFGERQADGTYVAGEVNFWSYLSVAYVAFSIFFILLAEVRKRTGKPVTAKTVLLALLWILGIVLLLSLLSTSYALEKGKEGGFKMKTNLDRISLLTDVQLEEIRLEQLAVELSKEVGRPVSFMLHDGVKQALKRPILRVTL